ncbi:MAG: Aspartate-semialdehyde dehydrogenase [Thermoleophilia bacterium]|nr:Aspartate-semialdehyde dehydrogenase [Thermoleophilia bacterium]
MSGSDMTDQSTDGGRAVASIAHATRPLNIAVVGATGNVGSVMLEVLEERGVAIANLRAFASSRSAGTTVRCGAHEAVVEDLETAIDLAGIDVALFSAGAERSTEHAQRFVDAGAIVIDNSSAYRMHPDVPLVVPEVNPEALDNIPAGIVANPNCSTIQLVVALRPLHDAYGLERVSVVTMQSTSGTGQAAMQELEQQSRTVMGVVADPPSVYPHEIAFNVLPHCDSFADDDFTKEELKLVNESRKILGLPNLRLVATCTRVPVFVGHSEAVHLELQRPADPIEVRALLSDAPGVELVDDPAANLYPMARASAGRDEVFVGRVRTDPSVPHKRGIAMFVVADNLRKGAATNTVQILEQLARAGRWRD